MGELISVVAPVYNEGAGVDRFVGRMAEALAGHDYELILVDDGSGDDSWRRIAACALREPRVLGVRLSRNFGKEAALLAGLEHATGDATVVIDADLQHPPSAVAEMIRRWRSGAQVVEAVKRNRAGQSLGSRLGARVFNRAFTRLTRVDLVDATDFRLLARPALDALLRMPEHSSFFRGTSSWIGFRRETVEVDIDHREGGASRWTARSLFRLAVNGLTSFTSAPLHLVTAVGLAFAAFSAVLGVQTLVRWMRGDSVAGFPTVILLLLVTGTFVLLGLGVIGEYLARIHEEVRGRPRYLVQERAGAAAVAETTGARRLPPLDVPEQWVGRAEHR
ncbi:glycosyltransferase family 2 protein [Actinoplanes teichomyceticus]|uniref:Glycosyltransferase involved in cell wall biosynthesis n=1 Tax=Actinoplanes teichomyceticus TaxID=1867 RepID=A0A561WNF4_ACTTI|nr:glycosyltransferase family 2 protein [Actinoplanes teichomyceticus]TWG25400.1 glycosyltransferase involved in cell wall biosynthesis [Actinoplanes teichomyceticus]GIF10467.1 glycosyltransferase [Actinoplanes teichomyceticus]